MNAHRRILRSQIFKILKIVSINLFNKTFYNKKEFPLLRVSRHLIRNMDLLRKKRKEMDPKGSNTSDDEARKSNEVEREPEKDID